jgi:hypothetical protein
MGCKQSAQRAPRKIPRLKRVEVPGGLLAQIYFAA